MRLLFVIDHFGSGGAQRQMATLALGLVERGHEVEFFIYYPQYRHFTSLFAHIQLPIHTYKKHRRLSLKVIFALRRLIAYGKYDAVLAFLSTPNFYAEAACAGRRWPRLVVSERSAFPPGRLSPKHWLLQQCHRMAHAIVVNSYHQRERMERAFPWMVPKIMTIVNGVDLQAFTQPVARCKRDCNAPPRFLVVGRVGPEKNTAGLIKALAICRERYGWMPSVSWAGAPDLSPLGQEYLAQLQGLIQTCGLTDTWRWLGERTDIPELLHQHDALIHASFYEGLPNAVCEALAAGRPVLVSNVCDHPRLVQDGVSGYLFDPTKPEDISTAMHRFATLSDGERTAMEHQARLFAERELSMNAYVTRFEALFERLLTSGC